MTDALWQVDYTFVPGIRYNGGPLDFPGFGLRLALADEEGRQVIRAAEHQLTADDSLDRDAVEAESRGQLDPLFAALRYLRAKSFRWQSRGKRLRPPEPGGQIFVSGIATVTTGASPVVVPARGWNDADAARLATWLYFASEAQEATDPATALRLYYLVIEEMKRLHELPAEATEPAKDLKAVRDFVSHPKIDKPKTQERLRKCARPLSEGPDAFAYRPSNATQRAVLDDFRQRARLLVDAGLRERLGVTGL